MDNYKIIEVNISEIKEGDTIEIEGVTKTICKNNIKYNDFMGKTLFGDNFKSGTKKVKKVIFKKWYKGKEI